MSINWSTMLETWGAAFALFLVLEGVMPFISPSRVKRTLEAIAQMGDRQLRVMGLVSMLLGVLLLHWLKS